MHTRKITRPQISFKRWKRASWALLASIGKIIRIGVLCVTSSLLVLKSQPMLAQSKSKNVNETLRALEEVVINTERPTQFQPLVRVVAVIQQKEIERAAVQNIQDLLRYLQGVDVRSRGSEGVQADLNILGGTFDQTMVMINGVNFSDPQTGHHSLNIPVDISQIERVEVLHGPGAWSQGSVAYAGAINIITKKPVKKDLQASLSGGEKGYFRGSANIGIAPGSIFKRWQISGQGGGSHNRSDGYTDNTDFEISNLYSNISLSNNSGHSIDIQAGWQNKSFCANSFYTIAYPQQFEKTRLFLSSIKYLWESRRSQLSATIYQRRHHDRFELFRYDSPLWYKGHNYHMNDVAGINVNVAYRWKRWGSSVFGADYRYEHIYSTVLGDLLGTPVETPCEDGVSFTKGKSRKTASIYLRHILQLERWRFTAGVIFTNRIYAGFAAAYTIKPYLELNGWVNNSYRNPTFTDLYYKSPTQTGNMELKPEEALSAQLGLRYTKHKLRASLSAFYRYGYRIIDWTRESGSDQWSAGNITNIRSAGVDFNAYITFESSLISRAGLSYSWMDVSKQSAGVHSLYATDFLRHKAALNIEHNIVSKLSGRWDLSWQKREGSYLGPANTETPYKGFVLADLKIIWNGRNIKPFAEATNLFNTNYLHIGNLPQPRRWVKAGVNITL